MDSLDSREVVVIAIIGLINLPELERLHLVVIKQLNFAPFISFIASPVS